MECIVDTRQVISFSKFDAFWPGSCCRQAGCVLNFKTRAKNKQMKYNEIKE